MATQDIIDYVMETPGNTNPTILKNLIEDVGIYEMDVPCSDVIPWSSDPNHIAGGRYQIYPEMFQHSGLYRLHFNPPLRLYQIFFKQTPKDGSYVDENPTAMSNLKRMGFLVGTDRLEDWWVFVDIQENQYEIGSEGFNFMHYKCWKLHFIHGLADWGIMYMIHTLEDDKWIHGTYPSIGTTAAPATNTLTIKVGEETYTFEPYANPAQGPQNIIIEIPNQISSTEENK